MKMKRIMAVLCALLMICALAACGDDNKGNDNKQGGTTDGPSAYELYTAANEAMNALETVEYNMGINIDMSIPNGDGTNTDITMPITGNMKQVKTGDTDADFDLAMNMNMDMSAMGAGAMDVNMYYTEGYLYYDMGAMGQMKAAADMAAAEEQMNGEAMAEIEESWIKESSVDGKNIHMVVDGAQMTSFVEDHADVVSSLGESGSMDMGDVVIDMTIDDAGLPVSYVMTLPMSVSAEGQTMTMNMEMTLDVVATDGVTITFPEGKEAWMEVDINQLG